VTSRRCGYKSAGFFE